MKPPTILIWGINGKGNTNNIMGSDDDGYLYTMGNNF